MKKKTTPFLALLIGSVVLLSGCSAVTKHIEQSTGNQLDHIDPKRVVQDEENREFTQASEQEEAKPPTNSRLIYDIVRDDGRGKYSGEKFDRKKVQESLQNMPHKLSTDKVYNYMMGLVGEGYKDKMEAYASIYQPNYALHLQYYREKGKQEVATKTVSAPKKQVHVTIVLDASGSMAAEINGTRKMDLVKKKIYTFIEALPNEAIVTIKAYGHKGSSELEGKEISCQGDELIYHSPAFQADQLTAALEKVDATGYAPLAKVLASPDQLAPSPNVEQKVIVITDGTDNCGGDVKQVVENLKKSRQTKVDFIAVAPSSKERKALQELAHETGAGFELIEDEQSLQKALARQKNSILLAEKPWQERALEEITHEYRSANQLLESHYLKLDQIIETESERLKEANQYILEQKLIDQKDYIQIQKWIEKRKEGLDGYSEQQWVKSGSELDYHYEQFVDQLAKEAPSDPNQGKTWEKRTQQIKDELKKMQLRKSLPKVIQDEVQ